MKKKIFSLTILFLAELFIRSEVSKDVDSFFDPNIDYRKFSGRVSDHDQSNQVMKIKSENPQIKFFRASDVVEFNVANMEYLDKEYQYPCKGFVRNVEKNYLTIFVNNLKECWNPKDYFRRGMALIFFSSTLGERVLNASKYRRVLLKQKDDFLKQLNDVNNFIWNYDQTRIKTAAEFDQQIQKIEELKNRELSHLLDKRKESIIFQAELKKKMDEIDESLNLYRIERKELFFDRWHEDEDTSAPVIKRPYSEEDMKLE